MTTIFGSFEIGRKALRAQHKGMEVSGQNVANANTPGYSRQRANLESVAPPMVAGTDMAPGQGVRVSKVERMHSEFYHSQMINTGSHEAYWETRQETYLTTESIMMEPDEYGINKYLNDFFDAWQELSSSPEEAAVRSGLREKSISLTHTVEDVYMRLEDMRLDKQEELEMRVNEANRLAEEIGELNDKLRFVDALQQDSNELLDKLDLAIEELSELLDIQVHRKGSGAVDIFAGGQLIVQEDQALPLDLKTADDGEGLQVVSHRERPLDLTSGRIVALSDAVNKDIPHVQGELDKVVGTLIEEVNELHSEGYGLDQEEDGINFFEDVEEGSSAAMNFQVAEPIIEDSSNIAASSEPNEPGNGENSLEIARLRDKRGDERLDGVTLVEYYRGLVTSIGVEAQECERMVEAFNSTKKEFQEMHNSVAGVNMDEEVLNMTQYQHAWQAASRYLSHVDEMLTVLFTELGR